LGARLECSRAGRRTLLEAANTVDSLRPTGLDYLWPARLDDFVIDLELEGDEGAIWKVEFEQGEPKHLSRDD